MKHAIRALGWATTIFLILVIVFSGTVVYSAMQIRMNRIEEEPQWTASNGVLTMPIPFSITNGGLYDISELNITTLTVAENETVISCSTTLVSLIPRGCTVNKTYDIVVSLDDISAQNLTYLLFNDTDLNVERLIALTYAHAIPLKISSNLTMPWGAPLSNLTIGEIITSPLPPYRANVPLSFENHAFFSLNGTISLKILDDSNQPMGSRATSIEVPPQTRYSTSIGVPLEGDPEDAAKVQFYFDGMYIQSWEIGGAY